MNTDEILSAAEKYIQERAPEITVFEGAATSDLLPMERYTGSLKKAIEYFGASDLGRFRFVTKFTKVESLLDARHNGHTRFRFSINTPHVIRKYEHDTPPAAERIEAARGGSGLSPCLFNSSHHPLSGVQKDYTELVHNLKKALGDAAKSNITFELISHRFTARSLSENYKIN